MVQNCSLPKMGSFPEQQLVIDPKTVQTGHSWTFFQRQSYILNYTQQLRWNLISTLQFNHSVCKTTSSKRPLSLRILDRHLREVIRTDLLIETLDWVPSNISWKMLPWVPEDSFLPNSWERKYRAKTEKCGYRLITSVLYKLWFNFILGSIFINFLLFQTEYHTLPCPKTKENKN